METFTREINHLPSPELVRTRYTFAAARSMWSRYCHLRKDIRSFVVDRMQKIKLTDESFPAPLGFSLESYLRHSFGMFREELVRVKVRFHKSLTRYLLERRWHASQKNKKLKDGSLELTFEVAGVKEIKDDLGKSLKSYAKL